jgi:hypothetical protein
MLKFLLSISLSILFLTSCSTSQKVNRGFASVDDNPGLAGTILGYAKHQVEVTKWKRKGKRRVSYKTMGNNYKATRIYFRKSKEQDGSYNVLLLEYVNLLKMAPKYILSSKAPSWINRKVGYLNQILDRAVMYKAIPTDDKRVFELQKLRVVNGKLTADNSSTPSYVKLAKNATEQNPIEGATITASADGEKSEIFFPANDDFGNHGIQYNMAKWVYSIIDGFKSTWRTTYLPGDYLGAYEDKLDVILKLSQSKSGDEAKFFQNEKRSHYKKKFRENQLTNSKSAYITGDYSVSEPDDGIFVFNAGASSAHTGKEHVDQKIGLFVDIFDASETKLNQDVVELIILNTDKPSDFLMYYEHPENGEGSK